jgi:hypothetical protein
VGKRVVVVVLVVVVASLALGLAYVGGRLDGSQALPGPNPGQRLVSSGVQSVTICEEHHFRVLDRLTMRMPGVGVGVWGPVEKGGCTTWYHYAEGEE